MTTKADLSINFCGIKFENPFCLSSSPVGNHAEMCARAYDAGWGGIVYKTLGLEKSFKIVMPSPRLSVYNYMDKRFVGLQNAEQITDRNIKDNIRDIAWLKKNYPNKVLISSIMGYSDDDWIELAKRSEDAGADMLELNFSCPQMARKDAGHRIGQDFGSVSHFTEVVKKACNIPVMAKMTPNITDMIPVFGQNLGVGLEFSREIGNVVSRFFQLPRITTGYNAGSRRRTLGVGRIASVKQYSVPRYPVEPRRFHPGAPISPHVRIRCIVGYAKQNIRLLPLIFPFLKQAFTCLPATGQTIC